MAVDLEVLGELERKVLWLSTWTIHAANHLRDKPDGLKVGGHQASSASIATIMTALYFAILRPEDRVAVKPHASPVFHAIQYLLGLQTRDKLERFRSFGGAQSYPSRTKDVDDVDFSTGSVGLGVAMTAFASLVQDYVRAKDWARPAAGEGRMIALVGDAELDEGNIYECLLEGAKHGLRNCWWIVDYNRQSLDGIVREGLNERFVSIFRSCGWDVTVLKYGRLQEAAFREPGGARLKAFIDDCPNALYSALCFQGGAAWRARLSAAFAGDAEATALVERRDDPALAALMANLGGHDLGLLVDSFAAVDHDRPILFLAYTIKGHGLPLAGHKDNHAGLMTTAQLETLRAAMAVRPGREWEPVEGLRLPAERLAAALDAVPFAARGRRRFESAAVPVPATLAYGVAPVMSTQEAFGKILGEIARGSDDLARRIVTTSPDVSVSTNLGPWINRRGLFARSTVADVFSDEKVASVQKWAMSPAGQHVELGIAENNLFIMLAALGLSHSLFGERLIPVGTLYDPFIARGLDALNYACYQGARFLLVATPSGLALAPEGGAHQSIGTPLIGIAQDGLAAFEPAFADELAAIMAWSFDYLQRSGEGEPDERSWLRDETGGSVYLRLTTRPLEQIPRTLDGDLTRAIIDGGYWLRPPEPTCEVAIVYQGALAPEAIEAAGLLAEDRRGVAVLAVTSADRLSAGWHAAERARQRGRATATCHVERLLDALPRDAGLVTVLDGHPTALSWIGAVRGHRVKPLGVEHFGQSGTIPDLFHAYGIDANAIAHAVSAVSPGRPVRRLGSLA
ncbi:transketolase-like TK C-terminal-containing protein [Oharaeibacter diazotrophicus]|uniref:Pyruvate dehydrogenase E1 component n=2 Tax=Oharaeibacter diazotrophicus TaxID=1920512 RepID=A0A4R6RF08_9HYPH|nr:transketolase [Oharaeibacter diazotrophicus]TDP84931.1 pyruvate dehydrogenase E1 component [Oharaeibacter diazotrophicus]BBE73902.1 pyruvate dehydrogenase E1 component [Pleomorphomonas sp. SM30]GLS76413.1 pyruvate dehydrogenase E1 component [Oharaeibacter diazotrophicus]